MEPRPPPATVFARLTRVAWWHRLIEGVDHHKVLAQTLNEGRISWAYAFMVSASAGIAMIGLLLNSPAVVIGAMLISPLMGPVVLCGLSSAVLSHRMARQGFAALLTGVFLAVGVSAAITLASPLHNMTAEILARTRPNLLDLVAALLAGLAAGYAVIRERGGTIVGVAIATSLMPPLAVAGYGIAIFSPEIARGALLLFTANIVAIGFGIAALSTFYGFGRRNLREKLAWQTALFLLLLIPLLFPLTASLRTIAMEAEAHESARTTMNALLHTHPDARISSLHIEVSRSGEVAVEAVVLTQQRLTGLDEEARADLQRRLKHPVKVSIQQLLVSDVRQAEPPLPAAPEPPRVIQPSLEDTLRQGFPFPIRLLQIDRDKQTIRLLPENTPPLSLALCRAMESELARRHRGWQVTLIPPLQPLPRLYFARGQATLAGEERQKLDDILWALRAWESSQVSVTGHASLLGRENKDLAKHRADFVASLLETQGIHALRETAYPPSRQYEKEHEDAQDKFRSAEIQPFPLH